jgi:chaperonin GroEL
MTEADGFVAAILAAPHDDSARLVFADWLEEHSDPRAGCLRLAARLRASYGPRHPDHSRSFWQTLGRGIEPAWWAEEARRLAEEVGDKAGDGSKTAVLIALALTEATLLFPDWDGKDAVALRRAAVPAVAAINRLAVQPSSPAELGRCLRTAALGDEGIGEAMLSAFNLAGRDGLIRVEPASAGQSRARVTGQRGLRFPLGGLAEQEGLELRQVAVLVSLRPLQAAEVRRALATYPRVAAGLLCLCPGLDAEGAELFRDAAANGARVMLCSAALGRWREWFEDAAVATGAGLIGPDEEGPVEITPVRLGRAGLARVEAGQLVIDEPAGAPGEVRAWITHLRQLIEVTSGEEQEWHCLRLAQHTGGVITVEIGGGSLLETEQLEGLSCGALHAGRAAIVDGYVPGGGVAYLRGAPVRLKGPASEAMRWALEEPTRTLLAGAERDVMDTLVSLRADTSLGLDVVRNELSPWRTAGPVDPTRVVRAVIEGAIASASRAGVACASGQRRGQEQHRQGGPDSP